MRIHTRLLLIIAMSLLVGVCAAAEAADISVEFEKKGAYICWFTYPDGSNGDKSTEPVRIQGDKGVLNDTDIASENTSQVVLNIMERKTGNVAIIPLKENKTIKVAESDFEYVGNVSLRIVAEDGSPVESALVKVMDGSGIEHIAALTPADEGTLHLRNVASGQINIKVETEGLKKTIDSDIDLPLERDTVGFQADVRVSGDVNTVKASESDQRSPDEDRSAGSSTRARRTARQAPGSSILNYLVGFILLAMIAAIIWAALRSRGVTAKDALQMMGVNVPEESSGPVTAQAPSNIPAVDSNVCPFCGKQKDAAGNCACSLTAAPSDLPSVSTAQFVPKLIGTQGVYAMHVFELSNVGAFGRDPGSEYALPNDSTVSRKHATITVSGNECRIKDEGSSNGTFVNGARITEQILKPGDEVKIGETKFRFEV